MIDLRDYYAGGYYLIRANRPDWPQLEHELPRRRVDPPQNGASGHPPAVLPPDEPPTDLLLSLSRCICPRLEIAWGWPPADREAALQFGIAAECFDDFVAWCATDYQLELDYYSIFHTPASARRFAARFMPHARDLYLIGAGLDQALALAQWHSPADEERYGITERIRQQLPLEPGGTPLGFEVASFSNGDLSHSWICSGLVGEMARRFGIHPGAFGLLPTREDAQRVYDWIAEDAQQGRRAEPEPYDYWLLVAYPLV